MTSNEITNDGVAENEQEPSQLWLLLCGGYFPGLICWTIVLLCVAAIIFMRMSADDADIADANLYTLLAGLVAFCSFGSWFLFFSIYPPMIRIFVPVVVIAAIAVAFYFYEVEHVSGALIPTFKRRGAKAVDELLAIPAKQLEDSDAIDLATTTPDDFSQFLGPDRLCRTDSVRLKRNWIEHPPKLLWKQPIGAGWSGFAAVNGFAVTLEQRGESELVTCYEVKTGRHIWSHSITARHETVLGGIGPRSVPTITGGRVYALGATGVLRCLEGTTGEEVWVRDLLADIGVDTEAELEAIAWGRSSSPLVVDDLVVVPYGGPKGGPYQSLAAFDTQTGEPRWFGGDRQVSYSSPNVATIGGMRQIVCVNENNVSAHDVETGKVLWQSDWDGKSNANANASQAISVAGDRVFLSKGYGQGCKLLKISKGANNELNAEELWHETKNMKTKFTNTAVAHAYVYGLSDGILECVELESGRRVWKNGRYGHGQILLVGDVILVQSEKGFLAMVDATPEGYRELSRMDAIQGKTWNNLCLYGRYLLVRNAEEAACFKLVIEGD